MLLLLVLLPLAGCGTAAPDAAPPAITLTAEDRAVWNAPPDRDDRIPVLLYHGIGGQRDGRRHGVGLGGAAAGERHEDEQEQEEARSGHRPA